MEISKYFESEKYAKGNINDDYFVYFLFLYELEIYNDCIEKNKSGVWKCKYPAPYFLTKKNNIY